MKRIITVLVASLTISAAAFASDHNMSINSPDDGPANCGDVRVTFNRDRGYTAEETIPANGLRSLNVDTRQRGGVQVVGWNESGWSIKACKAAASAAALSDIHVSLNGDRLGATLPDEDAMVYFLIRAPRNATLNVDSNNGPISVFDMAGTVTLNAVNGPIAVKRSAGTIDARTTNGPISFSDSASGTVKLTAQNGPIAVHLDGTSFDGSLDARTNNGPLSLKLPRGYRSGIVADVHGGAPVSCHAEGCSRSARMHDDGDDDNDNDNDDMPGATRSRHIELGSGPAVIHVATQNGPLAIRNR